MGNIASLGDEIAKIHWDVGASCVFLIWLGVAKTGFLI
jgi:hypothetical protein